MFSVQKPGAISKYLHHPFNAKCVYSFLILTLYVLPFKTWELSFPTPGMRLFEAINSLFVGICWDFVGICWESVVSSVLLEDNTTAFNGGICISSRGTSGNLSYMPPSSHLRDEFVWGFGGFFEKQIASVSMLLSILHPVLLYLQHFFSLARDLLLIWKDDVWISLNL